MEANELRIGNYVYNDYLKKNKQINGIFNNEIWLSEIGEDEFDQRSVIDSINPIPITEDWLLKFGFRATISNKDSGYKQFGLRECKFDFMFTLECNGNPEFFLENVGLDILYVHQLQNLYFSLTEKELTV